MAGEDAKQQQVDRDEAQEPRPSAHPVDSGGAAEQPTGDGSEEVGAELEELVAGLRSERDEYLDLARRAKADFENYKKRSAQQVTDAAKRAKGELARELLPVVDALERALESADSEEGLAKGVALVRDQLVGTLERAGVVAYDPVGERFDPSWHEALSTRAQQDAESGTVVETLDRGYRLDGQVLRPARVVVSE
jgi:molecular chaperone GrpE